MACSLNDVKYYVMRARVNVKKIAVCIEFFSIVKECLVEGLLKLVVCSKYK